MAPTKSRKAIKPAAYEDEDEDDRQQFLNKQKKETKKLKDRQDDARTRIRKNHSHNQRDLQQQIQALKRRAPDNRPGSGGGEAPSPDETAFGTLRALLARKAGIEQRIAECIDGLDRAMQTTSRELQVVLAARAEVATNATTAASTGPASTVNQ